MSGKNFDVWLEPLPKNMPIHTIYQAVNVCDITYIEGSVEKAITYLAEVLSTSLKKVLQEQLLEHDVSTSLWKPRAVYLVVCRDVRHSARKIVRELFGHQHII